MPRHPHTTVEPNKLLSDARVSLPSPTRTGQIMSRGELADAVNAALDRLYPNRDLTAFHVDLRWIGKLERGEHRWPTEERRCALREVLGAASDASLGLYSPRRTGEAAVIRPRSFSSWAGKEPRQIDTSTAHPARRYNYWLGGKDHYAADRESGDAIEAAFPSVVAAARANRAFLQRAVRLVAEAGVRQFLDIGTGLPAPGNTHEVAQQIAPDARVVYVDNDPIVMVHARALLTGTPQGRTAYIEADLRDPASIIEHPDLTATLNLSEPVCLLLVAVLHFIDDDQAAAAVRRLLAALPVGSFLVLSHMTMDFSPPETVAVYEQMLAAGKTDAIARTKADIAGLFEGLEFVDPGIVSAADWHADEAREVRPSAAEVAIYGAVGRVR